MTLSMTVVIDSMLYDNRHSNTASAPARGVGGRAGVVTPSQARYTAPASVSTVSSMGERATGVATPAATVPSGTASTVYRRARW
jgi:hypothetical protein